MPLVERKLRGKRQGKEGFGVGHDLIDQVTGNAVIRDIEESIVLTRCTHMLRDGLAIRQACSEQPRDIDRRYRCCVDAECLQRLGHRGIRSL
jgi:hypothetical protein